MKDLLVLKITDSQSGLILAEHSKVFQMNHFFSYPLPFVFFHKSHFAGNLHTYFLFIFPALIFNFSVIYLNRFGQIQIATLVHYPSFDTPALFVRLKKAGSPTTHSSYSRGQYGRFSGIRALCLV